jgi:hypothetical protein
MSFSRNSVAPGGACSACAVGFFSRGRTFSGAMVPPAALEKDQFWNYNISVGSDRVRRAASGLFKFGQTIMIRGEVESRFANGFKEQWRFDRA